MKGTDEPSSNLSDACARMVQVGGTEELRGLIDADAFEAWKAGNCADCERMQAEVVGMHKVLTIIETIAADWNK